MHIAAVQFDVRWEDREANYARVRQLLDAVELFPNTLVVLPEMFDTGFSMDTGKTDPGENAAGESFCRELASDRKVAVLAGVVSRAGNGKVANEAVAFSPNGTQLARYRKMQCFTPSGEHSHYESGTAHAMFDWQGVKIAPFICYDLRFPELFRPAALAGAELLVVIANWPERRGEHWSALLRARAIENQAFVLGVNRVGADPVVTYDGRTSLYSPQGEEVVRADRREQIVLAEVDVSQVKSWRETFPALRDARFCGK